MMTTQIQQTGPSRTRAPKADRSSTRQGSLALIILLAAVVLAGGFLASRPGRSIASTGAATSESDFSAVDAFVAAEMAAQRIPGLALAILRNDRIVHERIFGKADPSGRPVTSETPFIIGSASKSFTALAIMQLVEDGKVELDAPVQRYIPWFRVANEKASAEITVRHLLNQTSGLSTKTGRSFQGNGDTSDSALEQAVRKLSTIELTQPVGAIHQYSTINYSVLGLIVQTVSGQTYESYIQKHIFDPLQMHHSFTSEADAKPQGLAAGNRYWFGRPTAAHVPYNRGLNPAGYLISSADDMAHYLIAQLDQASTVAQQSFHPQGQPNCTDPPSQQATPTRPMAWAGLSDQSMASPPSFIRVRRSPSTPTWCSCLRAIKAWWC
jgi:CubicO group peptidase (beta-lactamase class C family)